MFNTWTFHIMFLNNSTNHDSFRNNRLDALRIWNIESPRKWNFLLWPSIFQTVFIFSHSTNIFSSSKPAHRQLLHKYLLVFHYQNFYWLDRMEIYGKSFLKRHIAQFHWINTHYDPVTDSSIGFIFVSNRRRCMRSHCVCPWIHPINILIIFSGIIFWVYMCVGTKFTIYCKMFYENCWNNKQNSVINTRTHIVDRHDHRHQIISCQWYTVLYSLMINDSGLHRYTCVSK